MGYQDLEATNSSLPAAELWLVSYLWTFSKADTSETLAQPVTVPNVREVAQSAGV